MQHPPIPPPTGEVPNYPQGPGPLNILAVAKGQQLVLASVAITLVSMIFQQFVGAALRGARAGGPAAFPVGLLFASIGLIVVTALFRLYAVYVLGKALQLGWTIVAAILSLLPCVGIIVLLIVNNQATKVLRENGIGVGLMGAKAADLKNYSSRIE